MRDRIDLCNYYCIKCQENNFCIQRAWHTNSGVYEDHQFSCYEQHIFYGIDICFVVDTTESMEQHLGIVTQSISKFQTASQVYSQLNALQYSIVTYWDHDSPYISTQEVVRTQNFTNYEGLYEFFNSIRYHYSQDKCEAMFDGLDAALHLSWRDKSKKYMILITDAPPHGRLYNNYWRDNFIGGCPCGLNAMNVLPRIKEKDIQLVILQFNQELNQTISEFRRHINVTELRKIQQQDFVQQLEKLICQEERNQEITASRIIQQM